MTEFSYIVLTETETAHYVVLSRDGSDWLQRVALFRNRERAVSYADVENMLLEDRDTAVIYDDMKGPVPQIEPPQSSLTRLVVGKIEPPQISDDEKARRAKALADAQKRVDEEAEPAGREPEESEPEPEPEPATPEPEPEEPTETNKPPRDLTEEIANALPVLSQKYPNGIDVSSLVQHFQAPLEDIRGAVVRLVEQDVVYLKKRPKTGEPYIGPMQFEQIKEPADAEPEPEPETDPIYAGLSSNQAAVYKICREVADDQGYIRLPKADISKKSGTARGSITYLLDSLEKKGKIRMVGDLMRLAHPPAIATEHKSEPIRPADQCACTDGRLQKEERIGEHIIRHWTCRCPKERSWTSRHDVRELA